MGNTTTSSPTSWLPPNVSQYDVNASLKEQRDLSEVRYAPMKPYVSNNEMVGLSTDVIQLKTDLLESNLKLKQDILNLRGDVDGLTKRNFLSKEDAEKYYAKKEEVGLNRDQVLQLLRQHTIFCEDGTCKSNGHLKIPKGSSLQIGGWTLDNNKDNRLLTLQNIDSQTRRPITFCSDTHSSFATSRLDGTQNWQGYLGT